MSNPIVPDPHTAHFDAWWQDFKTRLDRANYIRLLALECTYPRHAQRLHEAAERLLVSPRIALSADRLFHLHSAPEQSGVVFVQAHPLVSALE